MANYKHYGENYCSKKLVVEPEKASMSGLVYLLFSSDVKSRDFVECEEEERFRDFGHRWLIFISVLAQKFFLKIRNPLAWIGYSIETWLNLLPANGGVFSLFFKFLKGDVNIPDRKSAGFTSAAGHCDWRIEMEKGIKVGSEKYNSALAFMASKLSYENDECIKSIVTNHWKMECLECYNFQNDYLKMNSTQAFMFQDTKTQPDLIVIAFRGTNPFDSFDVCTDVDISWYQFNNIGKVHRGFTNALGLQKDGWPNQISPETKHLYAYYELRKKLKEILENNKDTKIIITGHSLGGALAILFVSVLMIHKEDLVLDKIEGVYTFGQPRVGDREFGRFMEEKMKEYDIRYLRYVYCNDMVPRLPYDDSTLLYKHFGPCLYYDSLYRSEVLSEEPNKNYFNLLWVIPKNLNAGWELVRGLMMPLWRGREYRESWFLVVFRVIGLVIPGLSAHLLQDYDNATRLGSLPQIPHHHRD